MMNAADASNNSVRSVVFDLFGVLMRFDTEEYYCFHGVSVPDQAILRREVYQSLEFAMGDRGTISEREAAAAICSRVPSRLHTAVRDLIYRQNEAILPIPGMEALLKDLKDAGYRLYLLSNTSEAYRRFYRDIPGIELFDDTLFSADVGLVKPDPAIYRLACARFGIVPSESVFIDDTPINVEAAHHIGMKAFVFHGDAGELREWLKRFFAL